MKRKLITNKILAVLSILLVVFLFISPEIAEARRGGSFGGSRGFGSRRSFGGSRSMSRSRSSRMPSAAPSVPRNKMSSFGGKRLASNTDYTRRYGTPRQTQTFTGRNGAGLSQNYIIHSYPGYGNGLMMGYMMGHTSWMWMMPFHPAFYYSRPYEVANPNGTISVYPPRFSFEKLLFTILIIGGIGYIIVRMIKSRRSREYSQSSFS
jgi:hypothetical protein